MNTPTISSIYNGLELWILDFLYHQRFTAAVVSKCAFEVSQTG